MDMYVTDQLVQFLCLRTKAVAAKLKLKNGQAGQTAQGCKNIEEVRSFVIKQVKEVFGDTANTFFGSKTWELIATVANGSCGFEVRAIIAGFGLGDDGLMETLSQKMRDDFARHNSKPNTWMDTGDLLEDLLMHDPSFEGRVFWIRTIATMDDDHKRCSVIMRANTFVMSPVDNIAVPEHAGAWPLAATPIEPPQPYHGARAFNSVLPCCSGATPIDVLDRLCSYKGPYIIYTAEVIGAYEFGAANNVRHIQVFKNTEYPPPYIDA